MPNISTILKTAFAVFFHFKGNQMENFGNDKSTELASGLTSDATSLNILNGSGWPVVNFRIRVDNELMLVTNKGAGAETNWTVTRGIEGTEAANHLTGAKVYHVLTAGSLLQMFEDRKLIDSDIAAGLSFIPGLVSPTQLKEAAQTHSGGLTSPVSIVGGNSVGTMLTCQLATNWKVAGYQWVRRAGTVITNIAGATTNHYTLTPADRAYDEITCFVSGLEYKGAGVTPAPLVPYLGQFAGQARKPGTQDNTIKEMMTISRHYNRAGKAVTKIRVKLPAYYVGSSSEQGSGSVTFRLGIQRVSGGAPVQVTWGGQPTVTVTAPDETPLSDEITLSTAIGDDAVFFFRTLQQSDTGCFKTSTTGGSDTANGEACRWSGTIGTITDQTMSSSMTLTGGSTTSNWTFSPTIIVTEMTEPSVLIVGDSRASHNVSYDAYTGNSGDRGNIARAIGPSFGYLNYSTGGDTANNLANGNHPILFSNLQYFSHAIISLGYNDLSGASPASTVYNNLKSLATQLSPLKVKACTQMNRTTSTDAWITAGNQTAAVTTVNALNALIRAGSTEIPAADVYELADFYMTARDSNIWLPISSGVTAATEDGIHANNTKNQLLVTNNVIDPATIFR